MTPETALNHEQRISKLEAELAMLKDMNEKLDSLLALKNKGVGAFWLASALIGVVITATFEAVKGWIFG